MQLFVLLKDCFLLDLFIIFQLHIEQAQITLIVIRPLDFPVKTSKHSII